MIYCIINKSKLIKFRKHRLKYNTYRDFLIDTIQRSNYYALKYKGNHDLQTTSDSEVELIFNNYMIYILKGKL